MLTTDVELHGEVVLNEDRVVHVVPRVTGIVADVDKRVGDRVSAGDRLAELDSTELGEA
jgi:cobalt-zinc-cadmium efflux system membrane fusion protein